MILLTNNNGRSFVCQALYVTNVTIAILPQSKTWYNKAHSLIWNNNLAVIACKDVLSLYFFMTMEKTIFENVYTIEWFILLPIMTNSQYNLFRSFYVW